MNEFSCKTYPPFELRVGGGLRSWNRNRSNGLELHGRVVAGNETLGGVSMKRKSRNLVNSHHIEANLTILKFVRQKGEAVSGFICRKPAIFDENVTCRLHDHHSSVRGELRSRFRVQASSASRPFALNPRIYCANLLFLIGLIISVSNPCLAEPEIVKVYTYHTHPPFITGENEGLTFDLAQYFSDESGQRFEFRVVSVSRPRLNKLIETPEAMIVPWVNPAWFKDIDETRYLWSNNSLLEDANGIISHVDRSLVYEEPSSIAGLIFGGIRGHRYTGIDDFIRHSKTTRRVDTDNHLSNFRKLSKGRIDVTLTPESAARYLMKDSEFANQLFLSPKPHSRYSRRVMVPQDRSDILAFIDKVLAASSGDESWSQMFMRYE